MSEKNVESKSASGGEAVELSDRSPFHDRADWIGVLAKATGADLENRWNALELQPGYERLRGPETGLIMLRGRAGGVGDAFNFGEATATRCTIRLESGEEGHAVALGRDKRKAEISALCDALMQTAARETIEQRILTPLEQARAAAERAAAEKAAATRVEFFTMARGEDD